MRRSQAKWQQIAFADSLKRDEINTATITFAPNPKQGDAAILAIGDRKTLAAGMKTDARRKPQSGSDAPDSPSRLCFKSIRLRLASHKYRDRVILSGRDGQHFSAR